MVLVMELLKKLFQFFYCLWSHLFPCPRVWPQENRRDKATLRDCPLELAKVVFNQRRSASDLVNVAKAHPFIGKPGQFIDHHSASGDTEALLIKGMAYYHLHYSQREVDIAENLIKQSAMGGNTQSILILAAFHIHRAKSCPIDAEIALEWVKRAVKAGSPQAMETFARMSSRGFYGLPVNQFEAFYWWRKAALRGSRKAMIILSCRYFLGEGCWKNRNAARVWKQRWNDSDV